MSIPAPSTVKYGQLNKALANVTTAANACNSWLHSWMKGITGTVLTGFTNGTTGAPPTSSRWSVLLSSNGTTAGAGDQFSAAYVAGEWLSNTAGNAHSYFVLQSPSTPGILDGPWYILVSKNSATATTYTVSLSKTAWTGGTTTADPTNAGTVSTTGAVQLFNASSTTAGKTHFYVDAKGNFFVMCSRDGSGVVETGFLFTELEQTQPSGDAHRVIGYITHSASGVFASINNGSNLTGQSILGFQRNGAAQASSQMQITSHNFPLTELNGINSDVEGVKGGLVISTLTANQCVRGYIPDLYQCCTAPVNGANYPDTTNPIWSAIGAAATGGKMLIPLPGVMSL